MVVFVTAYDQYALRAFEVHALDYLLKPVDDARFARGARARQGAGRARRRAAPADAARWARCSTSTPRHARRFLVRDARPDAWWSTPTTIDWIEAADYYASSTSAASAHLLRETMNELEGRLDPERFFRVHRSAIVNLDRVREIHPLFRGDRGWCSRAGARVRLSGRGARQFERLFAASAPAAASSGRLRRPAPSRCFSAAAPTPRRRRLMPCAKEACAQ